MRTAVAGVSALILIVSSASLAHADGMPAGVGPGYVPFSFTGFYIGANAGYGYNYDRRDIILSNNFGTTVTARGEEPEGGFAGGQLGVQLAAGATAVGLRGRPAGCGR